MKQLNPKAVWLFFLKNFVPTLFAIVVLGGGFLPSIFIFQPKNGSMILGFFVWLTILFLVILIVSFIVAKLSYKYYKYEMREDCFRKESGIIWKKYVSIPYERIQNVNVYRGLLARILGLSDLHIETAGFSGMSGAGIVSLFGLGSKGTTAESILIGLSLEDAEIMREELIKRAKGSKHQGL